MRCRLALTQKWINQKPKLDRESQSRLGTSRFIYFFCLIDFIEILLFFSHLLQSVYLEHLFACSIPFGPEQSETRRRRTNKFCIACKSTRIYSNVSSIFHVARSHLPSFIVSCSKMNGFERISRDIRDALSLLPFIISHFNA